MSCGKCGKVYTHKNSLYVHQKFYCGKEPSFACLDENCKYKTRRKANLYRHLFKVHNIQV